MTALEDLSTKKAFIMLGYPGSGKTTAAQKIAKKFNCQYFSSDQIRQEISNQSRFDPVGDQAADKQRVKAYRLMYQRAAKVIADGGKVVLDATHLEIKKRQKALKILLTTAKKSDLCYVAVTTPKAIINKRMSQFKNKTNHGVEGESNESIYQAWKRVYGYFEDRKKRGLISWPDGNDEIMVITYDKLEPQLA